MPSHIQVRGSFSSGVFLRLSDQMDPSDCELANALMDQNEALTSNMSIDSNGGLFKAASSIYGFYERPEPSFSGCFWPVDHGRARANVKHDAHSGPVVPQHVNSGSIADKHRNHLSKVLKEIRT